MSFRESDSLNFVILVDFLPLISLEKGGAKGGSTVVFEVVFDILSFVNSGGVIMPSYVITEKCDGCKGQDRTACMYICPNDLMVLDKEAMKA